jgi:hypothetical protein
MLMEPLETVIRRGKSVRVAWGTRAIRMNFLRREWKMGKRKTARNVGNFRVESGLINLGW